MPRRTGRPGVERLCANLPVKPVRLIVPFVAGGNTDIIARVVTTEMAKTRASRSSSRTAAAPARDRHRGGSKVAPRRLIRSHGVAAHVDQPAMVKKLPYYSLKDFTPISIVAMFRRIAIHPQLP